MQPRKENIGPIYYGAEYSDDNYKQALDKSGFLENVQYYSDVEEEIASLLERGLIVGRFNGRDEFGPRALGNRSILADGRNLKVIRKLNFAIKHRDFWMPFAPAVLDERRADYFINSKFAPYMIEAFDSTPEAETIIAGLHPRDLTGRPQTVNDWNPSFYEVLKKFNDSTGTGGMVNTSFNLHGFPIVGTPNVALRYF